MGEWRECPQGFPSCGTPLAPDLVPAPHPHPLPPPGTAQPDPAGAAARGRGGCQGGSNTSGLPWCCSISGTSSCSGLPLGLFISSMAVPSPATGYRSERCSNPFLAQHHTAALHHWWAGRHRGSQSDISCGEKAPSGGWVHAGLFGASRGVCRSERQAAANCVGGFPHPHPTYPRVGGNRRTGARFPDLEKNSGWCELLRALETLLLSHLLA